MIRYIYKVTFLKGKHAGHYYIGQHSTENIGDGYVASGLFPLRYLKKYGKIEGETYTREILEECNTPEELNKAEQKWIDTSDPLCTNIALGGKNNGGWNKGRTLSAEWRAKISASLKGHPGAGKGKKRPKEVCEKISASNKGKVRTLEQRKKASEIRKGKKRGPCSEQLRQIIAENNRKKLLDPTFRQKLSEGNKRRWRNMSEEEKKAHSERMRQINLGRKRVYLVKGDKNKFVEPKDVQKWIDQGWVKGRIWRGKLYIHDYSTVTPSQAAYFEQKYGMELPENVIQDVPPHNPDSGEKYVPFVTNS